jgi:class 3 adenylate cyclase
VRADPPRGGDALLFAYPQVHNEAERGLVWTDDPSTAPLASAPAGTPALAPHAYTPSYLAEKILPFRSALEDERKQVTVLFADLKGSTELIHDLDPEAAQRLLDPALQHMMDAVHRFEGTVNRGLGGTSGWAARGHGTGGAHTAGGKGYTRSLGSGVGRVANPANRLGA